MFQLLFVVWLTLLPIFGAMPTSPTPSVAKLNKALNESENSSWNSCGCTPEEAIARNAASVMLTTSEEKMKKVSATHQSQSANGCDGAVETTAIKENQEELAGASKSEAEHSRNSSAAEETQTLSQLSATVSVLSSVEQSAGATALATKSSKSSDSSSKFSSQIRTADLNSIENSGTEDFQAYLQLHGPGLLSDGSFNEDTANFILDMWFRCPPGYGWTSRRCRKRV